MNCPYFEVQLDDAAVQGSISVGVGEREMPLKAQPGEARASLGIRAFDGGVWLCLCLLVVV